MILKLNIQLKMNCKGIRPKTDFGAACVILDVTSDDITIELSRVMETVNQFCARRSYGTFVRAIGGKPSNLKDIIDEGYGYHGWVKNFEKILKTCNNSQSSAHAYLKNRIVTTPYEEIREEVVELLVNQRGLKRKIAEDLLTGLRLSDSAFYKLLTGV